MDEIIYLPNYAGRSEDGRFFMSTVDIFTAY